MSLSCKEDSFMMDLLCGLSNFGQESHRFLFDVFLILKMSWIK